MNAKSLDLNAVQKAKSSKIYINQLSWHLNSVIFIKVIFSGKICNVSYCDTLQF